eukprot:2773570-Prymnesium_polylepis.1
MHRGVANAARLVMDHGWAAAAGTRAGSEGGEWCGRRARGGECPTARAHTAETTAYGRDVSAVCTHTTTTTSRLPRVTCDSGSAPFPPCVRARHISSTCLLYTSPSPRDAHES